MQACQFCSFIDEDLQCCLLGVKELLGLLDLIFEDDLLGKE